MGIGFLGSWGVIEVSSVSEVVDGELVIKEEGDRAGSFEPRGESWGMFDRALSRLALSKADGSVCFSCSEAQAFEGRQAYVIVCFSAWIRSSRCPPLERA